MWTRASRLHLPRTGQTTSYRDDDDGYYEAGWPGTTRFVDNGDGTVHDRATGLTWVKDPSQLGGDWGTPGSPATMTWDDAVDNSAALDYAGHADWRLPNIAELASLVDYSKKNPSLDATTFPNTQSSYYWSSTTRPDAAGYAYFMDFSTGYQNQNRAKTTPSYVRPVRGGRINGQ